MTCHDLRDAILDAARGVADAGAEEEVRAHVEVCEECARRFEEQRSLTAGFRALVRADDACLDADAGRLDVLEEKLLAAFGERQPSPVGHPAAAGGRATTAIFAGARRHWIPAAAAAALVIAAMAGWRIPPPPHATTRGPATARTAPEQPIAGGAERGEQATRAAIGPEPRVVEAARKESRAQQPARQVLPRGIIVAEGFTPLPLAASLPAFESGEIVRTSVAPAALPGFGLDIPLDAGSDPIPVDLLVGQDGHPRAIRLVTQTVDGDRFR
ncbi:MAG: anti-sigma factor [Vicinamibacterales bacterium]